MVDLTGSRWARPSHRSAVVANTLHPSPYINGMNQSTSASGTNTPNPDHAQPKLSKPQKDLLTRHSDLQRFTKLLRRLKWKSRSLLFCHHRALHERTQTVVGGVGFMMDEGEAEMMFKIDFFEFYVLLERVLVHLLGVFGLVVTPMVAGYGGAISNGDGPSEDKGESVMIAEVTEPKSLREELMQRHRQQRALVGDSMMFHGYAHRFHANVLSALDLPSNPLHELLGTGVVRDYLGIAKEFRNRWKDAEEKPADQVEDGLVGSRYEKMLNDLKLEEMLAMILMAVETARPLAEAELGRFASTVGGGGNLDQAMMELDEVNANAPWEAMPDAMEWDSMH